MSEIKIHMIDQSDTKTSLEKLNNILQELHKNIMKESNSNMIKSSNKEEKNNIEEENNNNDDSNFINEIKGEKEENEEQDKEDKERTTGDNVGDNNMDKISNKNLIKIKISGGYNTSSDINLINKRSSDYNLNNNINNINNININNQIEKKEIKEDSNDKKEEDIIDKTEESKEQNDRNAKNEEKYDLDKYSYKPISEVTLSSIGQDHINSFNMTQGSELHLTHIIDKLGGKESEKESLKEGDDLTSSVKIDPNEKINLSLTNIPQPSSDDGTKSVVTNELDRALIFRTNYTNTKEIISNIDSDGLQREEEKPINRNEIKIQDNYDKKSAIDELFRKEPKKDDNTLIKENRSEIEKGIDKMYEKKLNIVKINNKEKFSYITKYNDPDKDKLGYEPDYFFCNKNSINFLNRRNNFLNHKYFSYMLSKEKKVSNNNIKEKEKKKKQKEKTKEENDINDNFIYIEEEIKKHKKNYKEKIEPLTISINYIGANTNNQTAKKYKINDVEDMVSFYYYFKLYSPEDKFRNNLEPKSENEILKNFTTYRKVLNDGNSFKRALSSTE